MHVPCAKAQTTSLSSPRAFTHSHTFSQHHVDNDYCGDYVAGITLLSPRVMEFRRCAPGENQHTMAAKQETPRTGEAGDGGRYGAGTGGVVNIGSAGEESAAAASTTGDVVRMLVKPRSFYVMRCVRACASVCACVGVC